MSARSRMTMRAVVQYNSTTGTDDLGQPEKPTWSTTSDAKAPCWAWHKMVREVIGLDKIALVQTLRIITMAKNGITTDHRIRQIEDRDGDILFDGPFVIDGDPERRRSHYEYTLRAVDSGG